MTRASGRLHPSGARARRRLVSCPRRLPGAGAVSGAVDGAAAGAGLACVQGTRPCPAPRRGAVTGPLPGCPPPPSWGRAPQPGRVTWPSAALAPRAPSGWRQALERPQREPQRPAGSPVTGRRPRPASGSSVGATLLLSEESKGVCRQNFFAFGPAFLGFNSYKPCRGQEYVYLGSLIFKWKNFCSPRKLIYSHLQ